MASPHRRLAPDVSLTDDIVVGCTENGSCLGLRPLVEGNDRYSVAVKSRSRLIDVPQQDDTFQENVDICDGLTIDMTIEDVGPLIHKSRSLEELDITVEIYFEEVQNDETEIE
ncbi:hypothetical protein M9H77_12445 [Catharanthus roseus]|uniref:Uncharacterized protein n=1 Tax=Catharanthus roseus TaxID=4058 RepID=A0ACC0BHF5_CATRO|nr:hypothetical protein M9H77_12445 [Catharanthus roseus]